MSRLLLATVFGACSDDGKVTTHTTTQKSPMGGPDMNIKMVSRVVSNDQHIFEYFVIGPDGGEFKAMEITYVFARMRSFIGKKFEKRIVEALITAYEEGLVRPNMKVKSVIKTSPSVAKTPQAVPTELPAPSFQAGSAGQSYAAPRQPVVDRMRQ